LEWNSRALGELGEKDRSEMEKSGKGKEVKDRQGFLENLDPQVKKDSKWSSRDQFCRSKSLPTSRTRTRERCVRNEKRKRLHGRESARKQKRGEKKSKGRDRQTKNVNKRGRGKRDRVG